MTECDTELFVCLDSDDYFTKDAADVILKAWMNCRGNEKIAGLIAHKGMDEDHTLYGAMFPDERDTTLKGLYERGFDGETTLIIRTRLLKMSMFPEVAGEKYVPEDYIYDKIDHGHLFKVLPHILTVCEIVDKGYTDRAAELRRENPTGWYLYYGQRALNTKISVLKIKYAAHYMRFRPHAAAEYRNDYELPAGLKILAFPAMLILFFRGRL